MGVLARLSILTALIGTFGWAILERLAGVMGAEVALGVGPIGFDAMIISLYIYVNPGTVLGAVAAIPVFRSL